MRVLWPCASWNDARRRRSADKRNRWGDTRCSTKASLIFVEECLSDSLLCHHSHALRSQKLIAKKIAMHPKTMSIWRGVVFMPLEYPLWLGMSV